MPRRRTRKKAAEREWYVVTVGAAAVRVARRGPGVVHGRPEGEADTTIHFEGQLDRPVIRMETASVMVLCRDDRGNPGAAIGGRMIWQVVASLPRPQFANLLALAVAQKVARVELLMENLRYGRATVRSVSFLTRPIPSEAEDEG